MQPEAFAIISLQDLDQQVREMHHNEFPIANTLQLAETLYEVFFQTFQKHINMRIFKDKFTTWAMDDASDLLIYSPKTDLVPQLDEYIKEAGGLKTYLKPYIGKRNFQFYIDTDFIALNKINSLLKFFKKLQTREIKIEELKGDEAARLSDQEKLYLEIYYDALEKYQQ